ncbi:LytR C-terminal domain-containing protein [Desulfopila inferna]|uniref:LytR C-terminal domain-containing protein n=1 Tax=Desulfopila inferna TaxID=468528 RepID=UPI001963F3DC|nr:LytR C-terminal domain-containing protein [Desulfopila inferna]MBM9603820.1 LytR C-terminal domain-containing protein [Desulfopila inferna]
MYFMKTRLLVLFLLCLFFSGCSFHTNQLSYFNMLDDEKITLQNREAAEKFWSSIRRIDTLSAAHYKLGRYYQQQGEYDKAIVEFSKAVRNDRDFCKAYNGLAMSYDGLKRCDLAHRAYQQAIQCDPELPYIYNNFACSSLLCGDSKRGIALLRKALDMSEGNVRIGNNLKLAMAVIEREKIADNHSRKASLQTLAGMDSTPDSSFRKDTLEPSLKFSNQPEPVIQNDLNSKPVYSKRLKPKALEEAGHGPAAEAAETAFIPPTAGKENTAILTLAPKTTTRIEGDGSATAPLTLADVAFEVSNGNGVTGMAGRSADYLRDHGFSIRRITNADHFRFTESIIYYRKGYLQAAQELAGVIPGAQDLREVEDLGRSYIGVRLLLGRDLINMHFPDDYYYRQLALAKR